MKIPVEFRNGSTTGYRAKRLRRYLKKSGFVLVAVLMMMILLVVAAVGLLSISTVALRTSASESATRAARANARLALYMALGDLQKHLGNDKRVTADASILSESAPRPHMVGVWDSYKSEMGETPTGSGPSYSTMKGEDHFRGWLVSKPDVMTKESPTYGTSGVGSNPVPMFFEDTDGYAMEADLLPIDAGTRNKGGYAWAVSQAGTKANISAGGENETRSVNSVLQAPDRPNVEVSGLAKLPEDGWDTRSSKVISMKQVALDPDFAVDKDKIAELSVQHSVRSTGVLADVVNGGLKTDLSLGFELSDEDFRQSSWNGVDNPFVSSTDTNSAWQNAPGGERPLFKPAITESAGRYTSEMMVNYSPVMQRMKIDAGAPPTFSTLRSYYSMYKKMYMANGVPTAQQRFAASPYYATGAARGSTTSMNPVLDRAQFFLSLTLGTDAVPALLMTPVVTLWNPYNVAIEAEGYVVYPWMDLPMNVTIYRNGTGTIVNGGNNISVSRFMGRGKGEGWEDSQHGRQAEPYFYCKITNSGSADISQPVRLEPGEVKVFAPSGLDASGASKRITEFVRTSNDSDASRVIFMRPLGASGVPTTSGLRMSLRQASGGSNLEFQMLAGSTDKVAMKMNFMPNTYHYWVSLEDSTRIKSVRNYLPSEHYPRITETQIIPGQGPGTEFTSPFYGRTEMPKVIGVLETFHRPAAKKGTVPGADIVYTVNPRQRYTNYTLSGSSGRANPHYGTALTPLSDISNYTIVDSSTLRGFYGASNTASGESTLSFFDVPREPMISLGSFQGADLASSAFSSGNQFGNSWASPYMSAASVSKVLTQGSSGDTNSRGSLTPNLGLYDTSYLVNEALWDKFFFSSIAPQAVVGSKGAGSPYEANTDWSRTTKSRTNVIKDWLSDPQANPLRNTRYMLHKGGLTDSDIEGRLTASAGARHAAAHIMVDGSFNVNSTNPLAWAAMLASLRDQDFETNNGTTYSPGDNTPTVRLSHPMGTDGNQWNGFRKLSDSDINSIAENLVEEVRKRGPFQSLSEFVNRRLSDDDMGRSGALQASIDRTSINQSAAVEDLDIAGMPNPTNITQNKTGVGTPGWVTQADLLTPMAPFISVRSDTFTIRAYGEARDSSDRVIARAYCEAVVQRVPEYVDPENEAIDDFDDLTETNALFGRKFEIVSIRDLSPLETVVKQS